MERTSGFIPLCATCIGGDDNQAVGAIVVLDVLNHAFFGKKLWLWSVGVHPGLGQILTLERIVSFALPGLGARTYQLGC